MAEPLPIISTLPYPKNLSTLIINSFPQSVRDNPLSLAVATATVENLTNEYLTPNEIYNFIYQALPGVKQFINNISLTTTLTNDFKNYSSIWLPYQYGLLIGLLIIFVVVLIYIGSVDLGIGIAIIVGTASLIAVVGVSEFDQLITFIDNAQTNFENTISANFNALAYSTLFQGSLGYISASQLTMSNGNSATGGNQPQNPIILTNPAVIYNLTPPYSKINVFQTQSPSSSTVNGPPFSYPVVLLEPTTPTVLGVSLNTIKSQYAKVIYVVNANTISFPQDSGIINILNAASSFSESIGINQIPSTALYPANPSIGTNIYPGEARQFINLGFNQDLTRFGYTGTIGSVSTWFEVSCDVRPFNSIWSSNLPVSYPEVNNKILFVRTPNGSTIDLTTQVSSYNAILNQELYIIADPISSTQSINSLTNALTLTQTSGINLPQITIRCLNSFGVVSYTLPKGQTACLVAVSSIIFPPISWQLIFPSD
jgi:hypothetical protein